MYHIYDCETYPNAFTCAISPSDSSKVYTFEVSDRKDDRELLKEYCYHIYDRNGFMVGYNNLPFDYPVLHELFRNSKTWDWYAEAQRCISAEKEWDVIIKNPVVPQIDLRKVWHFDNVARMQSLKGLEFALRMEDIQDLPYTPGQHLTHKEIDTLREYNKHDIRATKLFFEKSVSQIEFRHKISEEYGEDFLNSSDVRIGTRVLIHEAEKAQPGSCYDQTTRQMKQTKRTSIPIGNILLPIIDFDTKEFKEIHEHFKHLTVTETKGAIKDLTTTIEGFTYHYGLGGLHGSVEAQHFEQNGDFLIVDVDVASYYPNLAIVNDIYPEHLSSNFCEVYKNLYNERKSHAKGTAENAMLKLALNGAYGNSNNPYSPLYDPQYTMAITVNGQLLLSMLCDQLIGVQGISMIQVNTDGVTVLCHRDAKDDLNRVCKWWEELTGLQLEEALYKTMYIADVNSYLAVGTDGSVKRKGRYEYKYDLHQDPSSTIVARAAEAYLIHGHDIESYIVGHTDPHNFTLRAKMTGANKCLHGGEVQQKVTRFHMAKEGDSLSKLMPASGPKGGWKKANKVTGEPSATDGPLDDYGVPHDPNWHTKNKSKYEDRVSVIAGGRPVVVCNHMDNFDWTNLDYDWYIEQAVKLTEIFE